MPRPFLGMALVVGILVLADIASTQTPLKFLLLPPFGALSYLVFVNPGNVHFNFRRIVLCPVLTAVLAWTLASTIGYNPLSIGLGTGGTMLIMWVLDAGMIVPPLALELLTLLLHDQIRGRFDYLASVFAFTALMYGLHVLWSRIPGGAPDANESDADGQAS